jgi:hypothetical protein
MVRPLYDCRAEDIGPGDRVIVECTCGDTEADSGDAGDGRREAVHEDPRPEAPAQVSRVSVERPRRRVD